MNIKNCTICKVKIDIFNDSFILVVADDRERDYFCRNCAEINIK